MNPYRELGEIKNGPFEWEPCNVASMRAIVGPYLFRLAPLNVGCRLVVYYTPEGGQQRRVRSDKHANIRDAIEFARWWFGRREDAHLYM